MMELLKTSVECPAKIATNPLPGMFAATGLLSCCDLEGAIFAGEFRQQAAPQTVVIPAKAGIQYAAASRFITDFSGILDHPLSRVMTSVGGRTHTLAFSRRNAPEGLLEILAPSKQRAQGKPGVRCTRSRACSGSKHAR